MELFSGKERNFNQGTKTRNRQIIFISNCNVTCASSASVLATSANKWALPNTNFQGKSYVVNSSNREIELVDSKLTIVEWKKYGKKLTRNGDNVRCLREKLGGGEATLNVRERGEP